MAVPITTTHAFVSAKADGGDTTLVRPSNWNAAHKGTTSVVNAATDYGAVGDGTTDDTAALQNASNAAGTQYPLYIPPATYLISGTITVQTDLYAKGATLTTSSTLSPALLLRTGAGATMYADRVAWLPNVTQSAKGAAGTWLADIGVQVVNAYNSEIHTGYVTNFGVGFFVNAQGAIGTSYSKFFLGKIRNNKVNVKLSCLLDTAAWVNDNNFYGGNLTHDTAEGSLIANTRHILIDIQPVGGVNLLNNNRFYGTSFEGITREYDVQCYGGHTYFDRCRWESGAGGALPKVRYDSFSAGQPAQSNHVIGGYNSELIAFTEDANARYNVAQAAGGIRIHGSGVGAAFEGSNDVSSSNNVVVVYAAGKMLGLNSETNFRVGIAANASLYKRTTDTKANYRFGWDHDNGTMHWGNGAGPPDTSLLRIGAGILGSGEAFAPSNQLWPAAPAAGGTWAFQSACSLYAGTGVPAAGGGVNGDIYFRSDGGAGTTIYQKRAGTWTATAA